MQTSTTRLRIAALLGNVFLVCLFVAVYVWRVWWPEDAGSSTTLRVRESFAPAATARPPSRGIVTIAGLIATGLQPARAASPVGGTVVAAPPATSPQHHPGGPLAEKGWAYVWSVIDHDDPRNSRILLRETSTPTTRRPASVSASRGRRVQPTRKHAPRSISFHVREESIHDEELGLSFEIVAADAETFAYRSLAGEDARVFTLSRVERSRYLREGQLGPEG